MSAQTTLTLEERKRDEALDSLEQTRRIYLDRVRATMRRWAGDGGAITPDDARDYFESLDPPGPERLSRNFLGCVFRGREWEVVGTYTSATPGSHGNRLNIYRLRGKP